MRRKKKTTIRRILKISIPTKSPAVLDRKNQVPWLVLITRGTCSRVNLVFWVKMVKEWLTLSSVAIASFPAGHPTATTKVRKSLDTNRMKCCRSQCELAQNGREYSLMMKAKLNPMLQPIHLLIPIILKTRHLTVKTQSGLRNSSNRHIIGFYKTSSTLVK